MCWFPHHYFLIDNKTGQKLFILHDLYIAFIDRKIFVLSLSTVYCSNDNNKLISIR